MSARGSFPKNVLFIVLLKYDAYSHPNWKVDSVNIFEQVESLCTNFLIHVSLSSILNVDKCGVLKSHYHKLKLLYF